MKKNQWRNCCICLLFSVIMAVLCVCFAGMEAKQLLYVSELKPASASLISPEFSRSTHTSAEELIGIRQVSVKMETDQRFRQSGIAGMMLVLIMLAVLLANTVFYKEKKRLLTRYDADGRKEVICYIHHQDGQKH